MSELRRELEILSPDEKTLTPDQLCLAIAHLNSRIRHTGLSAREVMFQRNQTTNENIVLEDKSLSEATAQLREKKSTVFSKILIQCGFKDRITSQCTTG